MAEKVNHSLKLWNKIFQLSDYFHETCSSVHTPEEIKSFHDMPLSQIHMVKKVRKLTSDVPEGISLKLLAQELDISAAAASELVNILVNKGLLSREPSPLDRRAVCIKLSESAENKFDRVGRFLDMKTDEFIKDITLDEAMMLSTLLDKFIKKMESIKESMPHEKE